MSTSTVLGPIDYSAILLFFILMIGTGVYFFMRTRSSDHFFAGGRMVPGWISGLSFFMTCFSAVVFVGKASVAYRHGGWALFVWVPLAMVMPPLFSIPIAGRWHRTGITTVPEYLNHRFGPSARYFFAIAGLPGRILDNGNRIYATSVFVCTALGIGQWLGLWGTSFVILVFTFLGGLWAVVATDVIQFFLMLIAVLLVAIIGMTNIGGVHALFANAPAHYWDLVPNEEFTITFALALGIAGFISVNGTWSLIQRYTSTASEWEAKKVPLISGLVMLFFMPILYLPPILAPQLIGHKIQALVDSGMSLATAAERSYVLMCCTLLPTGIMGLIVIAVFSATMSALSAEYNIMSAVCTRDIYNGLWRKDAPLPDRVQLWIGRIMTFIIAALCTLIATQVELLGGAFTFMVAIMVVAGIPLYLPPLLGLYFRNTPAWGAIAACCAGIVAGIVTKFIMDLPFIWVVVSNISTIVIVFIGAGVLSPITGEHKEKVKALFTRLSLSSGPREKKAPVVRPDDPGLKRVIAVGCLVFALFLCVTSLLTRSQGGFWPNAGSGIALAIIGGILAYSSMRRSKQTV